MHIGHTGGQVRGVKAALEHVQSITQPILLEITKDGVFIEVLNPVVEHLVIEFVKAELLIAIVVVHQINLLVVYYNTPEAKLVALGHKPVNKLFIEFEARGRDFLPFKFPPYLVLIPEGMDRSFEVFS